MPTGDENASGLDPEQTKRVAGALSTLGRAAMGTASTFFSFNPTISDLTRHMGALGRAVEFVESQFQFMRGLSTRGVSFGFQIDQLVEAAAGARMTFEDVGRILDENGERVALFGAGVDAGLREFLSAQQKFFFDIDAAGNIVATETAANMQRLGYTIDEINDVMLTYDILTRATYNRERQVTADRNEAAAEFAKELDLVARLTGKQRQQIADEMIDRQREGDFIAYSRGISENNAAMLTRAQTMLGSLPENVQKLIYDGITAGFPKSSETRAIYAPFSQAADAAATLGRRLEQGDISQAEFDSFMNQIMSGALQGMQDPMMDLARYSGTGSAIIDTFAQTLSQGYGSFTDAVEQNRQRMERALNRRVTLEESFNDLMEKARSGQDDALRGGNGTAQFNNMLIQMNDILAAGSVRAQREIADRFYRGLNDRETVSRFQTFLQDRAGPLVQGMVDGVASNADLLIRAVRGELGEDAREIADAAMQAMNAGNMEGARQILDAAVALNNAINNPNAAGNEGNVQTLRDNLNRLITETRGVGQLPALSTDLLNVTGNAVINGQLVDRNGQPISGPQTNIGGSGGTQSIGSLGAIGRFFKNYGTESTIQVHGMESVLTPDQLGGVVELAANRTLGVAGDLITASSQGMDRMLATNYQNYTSTVDGLLNTVRGIVDSMPRETTIDVSGLETVVQNMAAENRTSGNQLSESNRLLVQLVQNTGEHLTITKEAVRKRNNGGTNILKGLPA